VIAGERSRFIRDSFHHATVATECVNVGGKEIEPRLVYRAVSHLFAIPMPTLVQILANRARRGLDTRGSMIFGMTRTATAETAEGLDVIKENRGRAHNLVVRVHRFDAYKVKHPNRAASTRVRQKHETIADSARWDPTVNKLLKRR
jgi:hypothetical protein